MSGAGLWVPGNHLAAAEGLSDRVEDVVTYLEAAAPPGWADEERPLWRAFAETAPDMLAFLEKATALRFEAADDSDPYPHLPGGRAQGRMVSPRPIRRTSAMPLQPPHIPHFFTYQETHKLDPWHRPLRAIAARAPQLLWRLLRRQRAQGTALVSGLVDALGRVGGEIRTDCRVMGLLQDRQTGAVTGVRVKGPEGSVFEVLARFGVVIATGGFERDETRRARHFSGPLDWIASSPGNLGDGHRMAEAAGARFARMDQANIAPALPTRLDGANLPIATFHHREPGALIVGPDGRRFVNEYTFNLGEVLAQTDETGGPRHLPAWLIFDQAVLRGAPVMRYCLRQAPAGHLRQARTIAALAAQLSLSPQALSDTVKAFNRFAKQGRDEDFARHLDPTSGKDDGARRLAELRRAPFYALPFNLSFLGTKGGPRTNARGQVMSQEDRVIDGLYACGLAMANPIGTRAAGSGTTLGPNLTWSYICGQTLVETARMNLEECRQ